MTNHDSIITEIKSLRKSSEEQYRVIYGELSANKTWFFDIQKQHKEDIDKVHDKIEAIGEAVASLRGSRRTANVVLGIASVAIVGVIGWGYHDMKTDIGIATEIEAKKYIDAAAGDMKEDILESPEFKKKVISIVTDKFFE